MTPDDFDWLIEQLVSARNLTLTADQRTWWWEAVEHYEVPVFQAAIREMILNEDSYPTPARARQACAVIVRERLARATQPSPPRGLTPQQYTDWLVEWRRCVAIGESPEQARAAAIAASQGQRRPVVGAPPSSASPRAIAGSVESVAEGQVLDPW